MIRYFVIAPTGDHYRSFCRSLALPREIEPALISDRASLHQYDGVDHPVTFYLWTRPHPRHSVVRDGDELFDFAAHRGRVIVVTDW